MTNNPQAKVIIDFWQNEIGPANWYVASDAVDEKIRQRFKDLRDVAAKGALDDWMSSADGALALILLLDQFSRNLYRGSAESFAADAHCRELAIIAIERGYDQEFTPDLRQFFYLPFCHSENMADQNWLLSKARAAGLDNNIADFEAHREIIETFGRFPFRNEALGRISTDAEKQFMAEGGYRTIREKWLNVQ